MEKSQEEIETIVNRSIKENNWDFLSSNDYAEFLTVTEIAKHITFQGKQISGAEITDVLEELEFCKRENSRIILLDKGKKYGKYAISIHFSKDKHMITDKGYAKYKIEIKDVIEKFISENSQFILDKRIERNNKKNETRKKNKELKKANMEIN